MPFRRSLAMAAVVGVVALLGVIPSPALAATSVAECGQLTGYVAPDPVGPADGSVQLGTDTWTILAAATVSPAAAAALPVSVNNGPTCLALDLDVDGKVTALDFAPTGFLSGHVALDSGSGFYLFADRLIIPPFVTDATPGLAAIVVTSAQAGTPLTITFTVDTTTGGFTGFDGHAAFCGKGSLTSGGVGKVGNAVIPGSVLDAGDKKALKSAGSRQTCASVHAVGTIDSQTGNLAVTSAVTIRVATAGVTITPPPTSTETPNPAPSSDTTTAISWLAIVIAATLALVTLGARRRAATRRED